MGACLSFFKDSKSGQHIPLSNVGDKMSKVSNMSHVMSEVGKGQQVMTFSDTGSRQILVVDNPQLVTETGMKPIENGADSKNKKEKELRLQKIFANIGFMARKKGGELGREQASRKTNGSTISVNSNRSQASGHIKSLPKMARGPLVNSLLSSGPPRPLGDEPKLPNKSTLKFEQPTPPAAKPSTVSEGKTGQESKVDPVSVTDIPSAFSSN